MSDETEEFREEIERRMNETARDFRDPLHGYHRAVLSEFTRIEIRMRAMAEAALDLVVPEVGSDSEGHRRGEGAAVIKTWCKERVWDNGDMKDCGDRISAHGYCVGHLKGRKLELKTKREEFLKEIAAIDEELACLARRA